MTNGSSLSGFLTSICHWSFIIGHLSFDSALRVSVVNAFSPLMVEQELAAGDHGPYQVLDEFPLWIARGRHGLRFRLPECGKKLLLLFCRRMPAECGQIQVIQDHLAGHSELEVRLRDAAKIDDFLIHGRAVNHMKRVRQARLLLLPALRRAYTVSPAENAQKIV